MNYLLDFAALAVLYFCGLLPRWRRQGRGRLLVLTLFYLYLCCALAVTLMPVLANLPFIFNHPYIPMSAPFADYLAGRGDTVRQILLNVLLTMPMGFLLPLVKQKRQGLLPCLGLVFLCSLGVELLQPLLNGSRSADCTDLITNTCGGLVGYLLYLPLSAPLRRLLAKLNRTSLR